MLIQRWTLAVAVVLALSGKPASAQTPIRWCASAAMADGMIGFLRATLAATDSAGVSSRHEYELPDISVDSVQSVSDERVCERAARAYYRYRLGPMPTNGVAVARVGNRYAVYGNRRAGEWTILAIYTLRFEELANATL